MKTNKDSKLLQIEHGENFHSLVQKLLHASKCVRLDLQVTVGYLCTQAKCPNIDDWKKPKCLLQYIYGTANMKWIMSLNSFAHINIFIDTLHIYNKNMRGQTGGCINIGEGLLHV